RRRLPRGGTQGLWGAVVAFAVLIGWTLGTALTDGTVHFSPLWHFAFAIGWTGVPVAYPFLVLLPVVVPFSQELQRRWIFYSRPRSDARRRLLAVAWTNVWLTFCVFFAYALVVFLVIYYVVPAAGAVYDPAGISGVTDSTLARLTALVTVHPLL